MKKTILAAMGAAGILALAACGAEDCAEYPAIESGYVNEEITAPNSGDTGLASGPALLSPEDLNAFWASMFDPETVQIIVDGKIIDAPTPFVDSVNGTVMLPLAALAEATGYIVVSEDATQVIIQPGTIVIAGENSYYQGREAARELSAAPVSHEGVLFVPWEFFQEILSHSAFAEDGNILLAKIE
ncbi:MAG: copper amine oxidase N-terminal domain-containing protein [Defluviitaleaceae bacterium]|nr:copper amine oxidase N-terminal domain-containing protein [Defluviitaleaceae bacterium]